MFSPCLRRRVSINRQEVKSRTKKGPAPQGVVLNRKRETDKQAKVWSYNKEGMLQLLKIK